MSCLEDGLGGGRELEAAAVVGRGGRALEAEGVGPGRVAFVRHQPRVHHEDVARSETCVHQIERPSVDEKQKKRTKRRETRVARTGHVLAGLDVSLAAAAAVLAAAVVVRGGGGGGGGRGGGGRVGGGAGRRRDEAEEARVVGVGAAKDDAPRRKTRQIGAGRTRQRHLKWANRIRSNLKKSTATRPPVQLHSSLLRNHQVRLG